jgi:L-fuculose-phosphate aldolase
MIQHWPLYSEKLLNTLRRLTEVGLLSGTSGNISVCLRRDQQEGLILITPSQRLYQSLKEEDLVLVDFEGVVIGGDLAPSSETAVHLQIYKARHDVNAVIHTHSTYASVLAVSNTESLPILDELVVRTGGDVRIAEYGLPGSLDLANKIVHALAGRNVVLMKNHGLVGVGNTLEEVIQLCELVERSSEVLVMSNLAGGPNLIPENGIKFGSEVYKKRFDLLSKGSH